MVDNCFLFIKFALYYIYLQMIVNEYIRRIAPLPKSSEEQLLTVFREISFPKGYNILEENSKSYKAYLIKEGIAHAYAIKNGKSATFWIGYEGDVIYPGQSLHFNRGEYGSVELLEDSDLYEIDLIKLNELYFKDINIANWGRLAAEKTCVRFEVNTLSRQFKTTLERYEELLKEYPGILQRVPLNIIASYLNTSQENLSRIRRKIK